MLFHLKQIKFILAILAIVMFSQCAGNPQSDTPNLQKNRSGSIVLDLNELGEGTEIMSAGLHLMDNPYGVIELRNGEQENDSVLVMAVHGYESKGYEWITGLKNFAEHYGSVFFFRYDWERCPDKIALDLSAEIQRMSKRGDYKKILLFGHSYGGMVLTFAASSLDDLPAEIHVIAAPLSGFPNLLDECGSLDYDDQDKLKYPQWDKSVKLIQHKTVHAQDGAFRDLATDPQEIELPFYKIQDLPPTMDGHRLGHNWSVTWVLDQHIGKPHR